MNAHPSNDPAASAELVDLSDPTVVDDDVLVRALIVVQAELARRAVERADPSALIAEGFSAGFTSQGMPRDPWLRSGILVCFGAKLDRSQMTHRCAFIRIGDQWVWEHPEILDDQVRHLPGPTGRMQSVSLVPVVAGTAVDLVEARTRNGVHELVGVRSFIVGDDGLELVSQRSVARISHR